MPAPQTPRLTVDVIIELIDNVARPIVLVERKFPPPGWAIPGGFVEVGETVEHAAVREAREETSLDVELVALLGVYSDPRRDPRHHTASVVYVGRARGTPQGADDAAQARGFAPGALPAPLAFDHERILADYLSYRARGVTPRPADPGA